MLLVVFVSFGQKKKRTEKKSKKKQTQKHRTQGTQKKKDEQWPQVFLEEKASTAMQSGSPLVIVSKSSKQTYFLVANPLLVF